MVDSILVSMYGQVGESSPLLGRVIVIKDQLESRTLAKLVEVALRMFPCIVLSVWSAQEASLPGLPISCFVFRISVG